MLAAAMPATLRAGQNAVEVQIQRSSVLGIAVRVLRRLPRLCAGRANVRFSKIGSLGPRVQPVLMWFSAVHCDGHAFRGRIEMTLGLFHALIPKFITSVPFT